MSHVFISYKRENLNFVQFMSKQLTNAGMRTWFFPQIKGGEEWRNTIDDAIEKAFALVVVMTPIARQSEYVTYEWSYAMGLGIPVITVMLETTPLHPKLEIFQYLDFTKPYEAPWDSLVERLLEIQKQSLFKLDIDPTEMFFDRTGNDIIRLKLSTNVNDLVAYLKNPDLRVRRTAVRALGSIAGDNAVDYLLPLLDDPEKTVRVNVINALRDIGNPRVIDTLLNLVLHDTSREIRDAAIYALDTFGSEGFEALRSLIYHDVYQIRERAISMIGEYATLEVIDILCDALDDPIENVRTKAGSRLAKSIGFPVVPRLVEMLESSSQRAQIEIINVLAEIGSEQAIQALIELTRSNDLTIVKRVLSALQNWNKTGVVMAAGSLLTHPNAEIRERAATLLQRADTAEARAVMRETFFDILEQPDESLYIESLQRLLAMHDGEVIQRLNSMVKVGDLKMAKKIIAQFKSNGSAEAISSLAEFVHHENAEIRSEAVSSLEYRGGFEKTAFANDVLRQALIDLLERTTDEDTIHFVLKVLPRHLTPELTPKLAPLLNHAHPILVWEITSMLERIGTPEALSAIEEHKNRTG